ncbi:MAG: double-strand break repair helicase AddA [Pseudomonadota bacterium]
MKDEATRNQVKAARPDASTWLSANAGSGKTRVLTDRVARLLLEGVKPENILCLTYTKAAASEMQNRLFKTLGTWAMMGDAELRAALTDLGAGDGHDLGPARTLFAAAIETPGGLKIQTIHSFCAGLLRRFPLEAGVSPNFAEVEDRAAELLRAEVVDAMATGPEAAAVAGLARLHTGEDFAQLTREIAAGRFKALDRDAALALLGLPTGLTEADLMADAFLPDDLHMLETVRDAMARASSKGDPVAAQLLSAFDPASPGALDTLARFFLTQSGTPRKSFPTKSVREAVSDAIPAFDALKERVYEAILRRHGIAAAEATVALHDFGTRFTAAYSAAKEARGWLDFDDLIEKARRLLTDRAIAAWVLFRLDGGIDHILVDEAQDTSPAQWDVIRQLAAEFGAGTGTRDEDHRTIFVVGDKKQSIYSFQGADPAQFDAMKDEFQARLEGAGALFQAEELAHSFRSSPGILRLVDQCFEGTETVEARHVAFKTELPGRVDLWPHLEKTEAEPDADFRDPVDKVSPTHHTAILAGRIAGQIKQLLEGDETIPDEKDGVLFRRKIEPRDIMILVQRRSGIFPHIIQACKKLRLPIAGADRLKVGAELAVRDLGALLSFVATQDDSLSLATALRSPLFGWSEGALFDLAHGRGGGSLWSVLRKQSAEYPTELAVLNDLRDNADFLRPYDLIDRVLTRHGGRARLLARLGPEAADGIDALLGQALDYERTEVPSLTGFLTWLQTDEVEIKRQVDSASNQIRVMTVHGAKGLEAPIVILPDCGQIKNDVKDKIIEVADTPVWKPSSDALPMVISDRIDQIKEAQWEEKLRLLYVALTRAEKWLIVAAAGDLNKDGRTWFQIVQGAMNHLGATSFETPLGPGQRLSFGDWDGLPMRAARGDDQTVAPASFVESPLAQVPERRETLSPSDLGGSKALPGPQGMSEDEAKAYGSFVHKLLEGADPGDTLPADLKQDARAEAQAVKDDAALAHLFAPDVLSEVDVTAPFGTERLHGSIDKLMVADDTVTVVDFKTNRVVPDTPADIPDGVLRQMGAYLLAVRQIYPDRAIRLVIVWTRTRAAMEVPHDIVTDALASLPYLDGAGAAS